MIEYFPPINNAEDYIRRGDLLFKSTFRDGILDNSESTLQRLNHYYVSLRQVYEAPAADVVEVVRCGQCKHCVEHYDTDGNAPYWTCKEWDSGTDYDGYCHYGKRKDGGQDE